jgi:hypothetical protein
MSRRLRLLGMQSFQFSLRAVSGMLPVYFVRDDPPGLYLYPAPRPLARHSRINELGAYVV